MQVLFKELHKNFKAMNRYSKAFIKFGAPFVAAMYISAVFCFAAAGNFAPYYPMMTLCFDFLEAAKETAGAIFVPALILQILFLAERIDNN